MLLSALTLGTAAAQQGVSVTHFEDDFSNGFSTQGSDAKWFYFSAGPYVGNDGIESTSSKGLRVVSPGTNPRTGQPAFTKTLGQEDDSAGNPFGLPGGVDHVKWLVYANHQAPTSGVPGYEATAGQVLSGNARISGRTFGTQGQPFGRAVKAPNDDLRLASTAFNSIDFESWMVFDFFITNERIYAFYERLPFGRTPEHNYAAFSYQIPLQERKPGDVHNLRISYDRSAGIVRWLVNGKEKFRVDNIGHRIDRKFMTIDHGGVEETVAPRQLDFGMGMFTILDGDLPSGKALVRLSNVQNLYFDPLQGEPTPQTFVDDESQESSRLFGQGAQLQVQRVSVESAPVSD
jgi:Family of unknown function (DUF6081)